MLALQPDGIETHKNLGLVRENTGHLEEAREQFERALALRPDSTDACNNLARVLMATGRIDEAVARYRQAVELRPADAFMHSNLIFALQFHPGSSVDDLRREHARGDARRWARVLAAVPESLLLLLSPEDPAIRRRVRARLVEAGGIAGKRVEFVRPQGRIASLETYGRIDFGLDPFPFNGTTTTCEALWMGVPVLACLGPTPGSRVGAGLLAAIGLQELIARSEDAYVEMARTLAGDLSRLAHLRRTLRARMGPSALMDAPRFAHNMERAYRARWQRWCRSSGELFPDAHRVAACKLSRCFPRTCSSPADALARSRRTGWRWTRTAVRWQAN